jgi:alpha-tubulin suppressor-like RCC1 family protein
VVGGTWESNGAIAADGKASYWGCKLLGESCFDNPNFHTSPQVIEGFDSVLSFCLGGDYACGLLSVAGNTEVRCLGRNREGQLGNASLHWADSVSPVKVDGSDGWTGLGCGNGAVFAWGPAGAYSWGSSAESGALGDGVSGNHNRQVPGPLLLTDVFDNPLPIRSIRGGMRHACAEVEAGGGLVSIYCWGYSLHGQVGGPARGENVFYLRPQLVQNLPAVRKLGVGWEHNCVILADDETVKCWGFNNLGCVNGASSPLDIPSPVPVVFP